MIAFPCLYKGMHIYIQEGAESSAGAKALHPALGYRPFRSSVIGSAGNTMLESQPLGARAVRSPVPVISQ
jgi:hypothetical protein